MKKHILVVANHFYPEQFKSTEFCRELVSRGYQVSVITQTPNYPLGSFFDGYSWFKKNKENYHGISIHRLPVISRGTNKVRLGLNYLSFILSSFVNSRFTKNRPDLVITYETSPVFVGLYGKWLSKRLRIPHIFYCLDLWPDNFTGVTGIENKTLINYLQKVTNTIYKHSDKILVSSKAFIEKIRKQDTNADIEYWPQFVEESNTNKQSSIGLRDGFNITFTGNVGEAQGLDILIETSKKLKAMKKNVFFNIVGDGSYRKHLEFKVKVEVLEDIILFHGRVDSNEISDILDKSDLALLTFSTSPIFELTPPAKLQTYMINKIPILGSCSGEPKRLIEEANCGLVSLAGDADGLVANILRFMEMSREEMEVLAENGYNYAEENFNKEKLFNRLEEIIEEVSYESNR